MKRCAMIAFVCCGLSGVSQASNDNYRVRDIQSNGDRLIQPVTCYPYPKCLKENSFVLSEDGKIYRSQSDVKAFRDYTKPIQGTILK
jgi:hypothetical protein